MSKLHLYALAAMLTLVGLGAFAYKARVLGFPVLPEATVEVCNVEAQIKFDAEGGPAKVSLFIPASAGNFTVVDEQFASGKFGLQATREEGNRRATWSVRKASGKQSLYYQAAVRKVKSDPPTPKKKPPDPARPPLDGPKFEATKSLLREIKAKSADTPTMVAELIRRFNKAEPDDNVRVLLGPKPTDQKKVKTAIEVLEFSGVPAREVNGIRLREGSYDFSTRLPLVHWIEVFHRDDWASFNPFTAESPAPDDWLPWWRGSKRLVSLEGGSNLRVVLSVSPKLEEGIAAAARDAEISKPFLFRMSLFSLPVKTQAVYRVILLVPVGAFLLVILRNVVGMKTFGTFMPVLIALAFRETGLARGVLLFTILVGLGLAVRFYLERLKLLVVPRLAAVLIVVVGLMTLLSVITHGLGGRTGLSVALFPMVIITMTIERMSITWEERGPREALTSGAGSLLTAAMAFLVMNAKYIEHLFFVFPELLLVLLAATILMGRYTGYRLMDLYRFRELAGAK